MIHNAPSGDAKARTVIVGGHGFVGAAIAKALKANGTETLALGRKDVDLLSDGATQKLAGFLKDGDAIVLVSALAPCKTYTMLADNVRMMEVMLDALAAITPSHVLYVSSDAVYSDSNDPLTEQSVTAPDNLHGVMHVARETMARAAVTGCGLSILRPTLVYGADDPHGGYGPNRFRRMAQAGEAIMLFGKGEERRDHVDVADVAELARLMLAHRTDGALNAATGHVISFMEIARLCAGLSAHDIAINETARSGPMPHNGYRPFSPAGVHAAFPSFVFTAPEAGIAALYTATAAKGG